MFSTLFILCLGLLAVTRPSESQGRRGGGPRVVTQPQDFEGEVGTSINLPCSIRNVGRRSVFWFKGDAPEGRELIMQTKSIRGTFTVPRQYQPVIDAGKLETDGSNLIIHNLQESDEDAYTCSIAWARQSVTHTLTVHGGIPLLFLTVVPADGQVSVGEGLPAALSCVASGGEIPTTVSWYKEGATEVLNVGNVFNFFETNREDSGQYMCTAENGVSEPISSYFDLVVEYVEVRADVTEVIASGEDLMAQLSCHISGNPTPQAAWYTSVGPVTEDSRHRFFSQNNTHYLQLEQMTSGDLGEYQCYGYNEKARDHATITVLSAPGAATILGVSPTEDQRRYIVTWKVNSLAPIRFYYVTVKEENSDEVNNISVAGSSSPDDGFTLYQASSNFNVTPGHTYEIMVKAVAEENQPGPDQEQPFVFTAPGEIKEPDSSEEDSPEEDSYYESENSVPASEASYPGPSNETPVDDDTTQEDAWKWWKLTMTLMSRLPQVARIMQE